MSKNLEFIEALDYDIKSNWWASLVFWDKGQEIVAKYLVWKTSRKYNRYIKFQDSLTKIKP